MYSTLQKGAIVLKVLILGSCVSNDAFDMIKNDIKRVGYIPRTSLASAFTYITAPVNIINTVKNNIENLTYKYWVLNDLEKRVGHILTTASYDILLLDLMDERFNLALSGGAVMTLSTEFEYAKVNKSEYTVVKSCSDEHFELWKLGIERFSKLVPADKVYVNKIYWTSRVSDMMSLHACLFWIRSKRTVYCYNSFLDKCYKHIKSNYSFKFIEYPPNVLLADPLHVWGIGPMHFVKSFYSQTISHLTEIERKLD
jgi:hypothetical protein